MTAAPSQNRSWSISIAAAVVLVFLLALFLRTYFVFGRCFTDDYVNFQETDPWYHVRAVEHLIEQFPWRLSWDP